MIIKKNNPFRPDGGFGVYIHWPFCKAKCPYCDFNSHVRHSPVDQKNFAKALVEELSYQHQFSSPFIVESIFFGGGTPSLMHPETVSYILEQVYDLWDISGDVEISLEANPTSVEAENFKAYRDAGVNRISLGIQSLKDEDLDFLGRQHSAQEALKALETARDIFSRVSADMIYTRPGQTPDGWRHELGELLNYDLDHLSLYQLTIEPKTPFEALYKAGKIAMPEDNDARALFEVNQEVCESVGLHRYEVSNHAKNHAECRHNLIYWNYGFYAGIGPGAHARLLDEAGRFALQTESSPEDWLAKVSEKGHGTSTKEELADRQAADELLLMGLRLTEGIDLARYEKLSMRPPDYESLSILREDGLINIDVTKNKLRVTEKGVPVLNHIIERVSRSFLMAQG